MVRLRSYLLLLPLLGGASLTATADDPKPAPTPAPGTAPASPGAPDPVPPPLPPPKFEEGLIQRSDGTVVYFYRTNFVGAVELIASSQQMTLQPAPVPGAAATAAPQPLGVKLTPFKEQNTVLLEGSEEAVLVALDVLAYFDVAAPQVFIEAKVVEITHDTNFEFGLDHLFTPTAGSTALFQGGSGLLRPPSAIAAGLPGGLPFSGTSMLLGRAMNLGAFEVNFRALQESGKAEILSKPSVLCTQGIEAKITTTEQFEVNRFTGAGRNANLNAAGVVTSTTTSETYAVGTATTGVSLTVKATHIGDQYVTLDLNPIVNGLAGLGTRLGGTTNPIVTMRSAKTTVTLGDGETLVIAGLYTNRVVNEQARTPLLSDIPLIGTIFTRQHQAKQKSELMIIVTPRIVHKGTDSRMIVPPAELERLEKKPNEDPNVGKLGGCGPCAPLVSMEDVLYPREPVCRALQERSAARQAAKPASGGAATPSPGAATPSPGSAKPSDPSPTPPPTGPTPSAGPAPSTPSTSSGTSAGPGPAGPVQIPFPLPPPRVTGSGRVSTSGPPVIPAPLPPAPAKTR